MSDGLMSSAGKLQVTKAALTCVQLPRSDKQHHATDETPSVKSQVCVCVHTCVHVCVRSIPVSPSYATCRSERQLPSPVAGFLAYS